MTWYAVFRGRKPGVYAEWSNCNEQVTGFPNNCYKGYQTRQEAMAAIQCYQEMCLGSTKDGLHEDDKAHKACRENKIRNEAQDRHKIKLLSYIVVIQFAIIVGLFVKMYAA
ncbi:hypothetical protein U9M48_008109 [Paspalum notatum var. saurae]|uniref:Ribonuclease H n=1 Tax=Paspalum notatum var. saurae TaxID=547442 RepID=A0AAQ3SNE6_PASNO